MFPDLNHFLSPRAPKHAEDIGAQLRALPAELPAPYDWAEFRRRSRNRFPARRTLVKWPHAAAAAGLTALVATMAMLGTSDDGRDGAEGRAGPPVAQTNSNSARSMSTDSTRFAVTGVPSAGQARETREWLARQPAEPAVVRVGPRIAVANLEDRIAWFDDALTDERLQGVNPASLKVLQQERARLMSSLAQVRYAEALAADGS
jgi:hypothetical protein